MAVKYVFVTVISDTLLQSCLKLRFTLPGYEKTRLRPFRIRYGYIALFLLPILRPYSENSFS